MPPQGHSLKQWLFGGEIPVENALFNVADYSGNIVSDLFGEDSYFDDAEKFWELQNKVISEAKRQHHAEGWSEVIVMDIGQQWYRWDHVETPQNEGGRIYIQISHNGEVTYHVGYLTEKEAKRKAADEHGDPLTSPKAEITKAMQNYLALHRHAAVRAELLDHSGIALRLAVAQQLRRLLRTCRNHSARTRFSAIVPIACQPMERIKRNTFKQQRLRYRNQAA